MAKDFPADRKASLASFRSNPKASVPTPRAKPPRKSAITGSTAHVKTLPIEYFGSSGPRTRGISVNSNNVGTNGGTASLIHKYRQTPATDATRA